MKHRKWFMALGLMIGLAIGSVLHCNAKTVYQSTATVTVLPSSGHFRIPRPGECLPDYEVRLLPDILITQKDIISTALKTDESIQDLPSLKNFNDDEKVEYIVNNLNVEQNREELTIYNVALRNSHEGDGQKILRAVLAAYDKNLKEHAAAGTSRSARTNQQIVGEPKIGVIVWPILSLLLVYGGALGMLGGFALGFLANT